MSAARCFIVLAALAVAANLPFLGPRHQPYPYVGYAFAFGPQCPNTACNFGEGTGSYNCDTAQQGTICRTGSNGTQCAEAGC